MKETIGFIGLGNMGLPMITNLSRAGYSLRVFDLSQAASLEASRLNGVTTCTSSTDVAEGSGIVFTVLPNDEIVTETYLGEQGLLSKASKGLITCDCSTVSPQVSQRINGEAAKRGVSHMDTPMLGSKPQAISGDIFFIVAGDESKLPRLKPLLEVMGKLHMYVGPSGTANQIKLIHNILGAVNSAAVAESLAMCVQSSVDPRTFFDVVANGGGMAFSTYFGKRVERILDGEFSPQFSLGLMHKDVSLAMGMADSAGIPQGALPIMEETLQTYAEGLEGGWREEDFSGVTHVIEKRIGRKISGK